MSGSVRSPPARSVSGLRGDPPGTPNLGAAPWDKPYLVAGQAQPFCYVTRYTLTAQ
jgi:hypothetical protein